MKRFMKRLHRGEKGFTLIELLIVIAILGIIAAIVIPNAAGFMITGTINAANTELANVKTASVGYMAEHDGVWPTVGTAIATGGVLTPYLSGTLKGTYTFGADGFLTAATYDTDLKFCDGAQKFIRTGGTCP